MERNQTTQAGKRKQLSSIYPSRAQWCGRSSHAGSPTDIDLLLQADDSFPTLLCSGRIPIMWTLLLLSFDPACSVWCRTMDRAKVGSGGVRGSPSHGGDSGCFHLLGRGNSSSRSLSQPCRFWVETHSIAASCRRWCWWQGRHAGVCCKVFEVVRGCIRDPSSR